MKKIITAAANEIRNISEQKLTIGLDLGDRSSWYCVLDDSGRMVLEQRVSTNGESAGRGCGAAEWRWKRECIRRG